MRGRGTNKTNNKMEDLSLDMSIIMLVVNGLSHSLKTEIDWVDFLKTHKNMIQQYTVCIKLT